jgi:pimeloyl-ACP methyl ester carboxylesterase
VAKAKSNGIELEYETIGDPGDPPMVLIMGLGAQLIDWPVEFCTALAERGYQVIRFDNRDCGLSTGFDDAGAPDLAAATAGQSAYKLADLAADTAGLLDALDIDRAHVVGVSMGGMIAQQFAVDHPRRLLSLCSIMSTTGDRSVGGPTPEASAALTRPPAANRSEAIANQLASSAVIGSPGYPVPDDERRQRATAKYDRAYRPLGAGRQLAAVIASPDRTAGLHSITVPALVIHGAEDPLVDVSGGRATAAAIPGAELLVLPGMGHDLPQPLWPQIIDAIDANAGRAAA